MAQKVTLAEVRHAPAERNRGSARRVHQTAERVQGAAKHDRPAPVRSRSLQAGARREEQGGSGPEQKPRRAEHSVRDTAPNTATDLVAARTGKAADTRHARVVAEQPGT